MVRIRVIVIITILGLQDCLVGNHQLDTTTVSAHDRITLLTLFKSIVVQFLD